MSNCQPLLIAENNDIKTAIKVLTEELYACGYPTLPSYDESKGADYVVIPLINTVWTLVKHRKKYVAEKREIDHSKMILEQSIKKLQKKVSDLESNQVIMKSDLKKFINELEVTKFSKEQLQQNLNHSKMTIKKIQKLLQSRNEEYDNKIRQKEHEVVELQNLLSQKIELRRNCGSFSTNTPVLDEVEVMNEKMKQKQEEFAASTSKVSNSSKEEIDKMNKICISKLENTVQTLVQENINLRNSVGVLLKKLCSLHKDVSSAYMKDKLFHDSQDYAHNCLLLDNDNNDFQVQHLFNIPGNDIINYLEEHVTQVMSKIMRLVSLLNIK